RLPNPPSQTPAPASLFRAPSLSGACRRAPQRGTDALPWVPLSATSTRSQIYVSLPALATVTSDGDDDLAVHVTARLQGHGVADLLEREPRSDRHGDRSGDDRIGDPPQLLGAGIEASGCAHTSGRVRAGSDRRDSFGTHTEGQGGFHHLGVE